MIKQGGPVEHLTVKDVADELNISIGQAHKLIQGGVIPAIDIGSGRKSYWRVERDDFNRWLAAEREKTARRFGTAS